MLNHAQLEQFERQGILVIEDVIDAETLQAVRAEYAGRMNHLYDTWQRDGLVPPCTPDLGFWEKLNACHEAGIDWFQSFDISLPHDNIREDTPMFFGPETFKLVTHDKVLDIVESLIGPEITSNPIQHVRIKPPQRDVSADENRAHITKTAWHQDRGVGREAADQSRIITVWMAITDATPENGCLQAIPGRVKGLYPHCLKNQTAIADGFIDESEAVPLPVKAGGIVLLHPLTPHSSLSNTTDGYRWSFDLRYNVTGDNTGRTEFPDFIARSRTAPDTVLTDWRAWRTLWEDARVAVAMAPHVPQHRWPNNGPHCA